MKHIPLLCAVGSFCLSAPAAEQTRPNVLFVIIDDLTTAIGCYGDRDARTPNMDALAARGVRFEHAYCQFSLCAPSRASFLTGCYPDRTKVYNLSTSFRVALPDVVTLPELFKKEGYATVLIGKVFHNGGPKIKPDLILSAPLHKDNGILAEAKAKNDPADQPHGKAGGEEKGENYNRCYAASDRPDKDFTDYEIADRAIAALEQFKDKPFFLTVGFIRPHTPYVAPQAFFDQFDPKEISMPPFYRPDGEDRSLIPEAALRPNNNVFRYQAPTLEEARDARRAYLAASSFSDSQLGRVLAKLKELDLDKNT
ncbi:MAG: sulfatase-like hydrolase/transferase, partial [Kiritimatiellales bacterium]